MLKLFTAKFVDKLFEIPLGDDGACIIARHVSATKRNEIYRKADLEAAGDSDTRAKLFATRFLQAAIEDWRGVVDVSEEAIPYSGEIIPELVEHDREQMEFIFSRLTGIARIGKVLEEKN